MKIKTEIVQSIFIVTCNGPHLDAVLAKDFLTAMDGFISRSRMDILLDLSNVRIIDSNGLSSIVRSLKTINGYRQLIVCGIDERVLGLLKMTNLHSEFTRSASRNETLSNQFWAQKNKISTIQQAVPRPSYISKDNRTPGPDIEEAYAVLLEVDDVAAAESVDYLEYTAGEPQKQETAAPEEDESELAEVIEQEERRKYRRIDNKQIMDEEITLYCKNTDTGRRHRAVVLNISPGGLRITSSAKHLSVGDKLLVEGRLGKNFKFKEYAVSRSCLENDYGLEFINLSSKSIQFLDQLSGAIEMKQANKYRNTMANNSWY